MTSTKSTHPHGKWSLVRRLTDGRPYVRVEFHATGEQRMWIHWIPLWGTGESNESVAEERHLFFAKPYTCADGSVLNGLVLQSRLPNPVDVGLARHIWLDMVGRNDGERLSVDGLPRYPERWEQE